MASRQFSKSKASRGPVVTDLQPKMRQLSLRACLQLESPVVTDLQLKPKRKYTARGTGGTFGGQRPPKDLRLKVAFEQRRQEHQAEIQVKKTKESISYEARAYHKFMKEMLPLETSGSSRERFLSVVHKWKAQRSEDEAMVGLLTTSL